VQETNRKSGQWAPPKVPSGLPERRSHANAGAPDQFARGMATSVGLAKIRPTTPAAHRFETEQDAIKFNIARCKILEKRLPKIAQVIDSCSKHDRCKLPICAVCALEYRRPVVEQIVSLAQSYKGLHQTVTINLDTIEPGELANADLKKMREALKKRVDRAGFKDAMLIGCIEAGWKASKKHWVLHAHLLAVGADEDMWERLRQASRHNPKAVVVKPLNDRDLEKQISYIVKFVTYHRPGERGASNARAYPLPPDRLVEWASWIERSKFKDFLFLYGVRRRGEAIVPVAR
jgi:hypothetical protein